MPVDLKKWLFRSNSFCFCVPIRAGFVLMSILTFLLSGAVSIIIWFELSHAHQVSFVTRVVLVLTGIVESLLLLASIIGFLGVVAHKQLFVTIYTYFVYIHFVLDLIVGIYFLVTVHASDRQQLVNYCAEVLTDTSMESSCTQLTNVSMYVFIAIVAALLFLEFYGAMIATRYVYCLRIQKRDDQSRRLGYFHTLSTPETGSASHTRQASGNTELLHSQEGNGDPRELDDVVLDIRVHSYMPVPTYDRDLPPVPAPSQSLSPPYPPSDMGFNRRIRALPPRPVDKTIPAVVIQTFSGLQGGAGSPGRPLRPHERVGHSSRGLESQLTDSEDGQHSLDTAQVSPSAHAALMDHAIYMGSMFTYASSVPNHSQRSLR